MTLMILSGCCGAPAASTGQRRWSVTAHRDDQEVDYEMIAWADHARIQTASPSLLKVLHFDQENDKCSIQPKSMLKPLA